MYSSLPLPAANANASPAGTLGGVSPRFFQPSINPASWRAGQRSLSMPSASMTCFNSLIWSSVSRIVNPDLRPTSSTCRRRIFTPIEWNVPSHVMPSTPGPINLPIRSRISRAALLVKVTARICDGQARPEAKMWAMRVVRTRVLPVPAPARTSNGPSVCSTAARCSAFNPSRKGAVAAGAVGRPAAMARAEIDGFGAGGAWLASGASGRSNGGSSKPSAGSSPGHGFEFCVISVR